MKHTPLLALVALGAIALVGCDGGENASTPYPGVLGQGSVPLAASTPDPGILADAATYQPAKLPAGGAGPKPAGGGGADTGAAEIVGFLLDAIRDSDATLAMRAFEAEHVAVLTKDKLDPLLDSLALVGEIADELDDTVVNRVLAGLRGAAEKPRVDTVDAQNASATPNVARVLLGPKAGGDALKVKKGPQGWKIQLDAPMTDADLEAITAYHKTLQENLARILDWMRATKPIDEAKLKDAAAKALRGEPVDLPAAGGGSGETPAQPGESERRP